MRYRNFAWLGVVLAMLALGPQSASAQAKFSSIYAGGTLVVDSSQAITGTNGIFSGTLAVTGAGTFNGAVTHNAALTVAGGNKVTFSNSAGGGLFLNGTATAIMDPSGNLNVPGTLTQTGASTFNGAITAAAALTVTGGNKLTFSNTSGGGLFLNGTSTAIMDTSGNLNVPGTLTQTGASTFQGNVSISGSNTFTAGGLATLSAGFTSPASCTITNDKVFTGLRPESYGSSANFPSATTANRGRLIWNVADKHYYMSDSANFIQVGLANDSRAGTIATAGNATSGSVSFTAPAMASTPVVNLSIGSTGSVNASAYNLVQVSSITTTGFTWNMDTNPGNAVLQWHAVPAQ